MIRKNFKRKDFLNQDPMGKIHLQRRYQLQGTLRDKCETNLYEQKYISTCQIYVNNTDKKRWNTASNVTKFGMQVHCLNNNQQVCVPYQNNVHNKGAVLTVVSHFKTSVILM